jgi:hypothetical protein
MVDVLLYSYSSVEPGLLEDVVDLQGSLMSV